MPAQYSDIHQGKLTPWKPGDPIATGQIYLPDAESRAAYGAEVQRQLIESWARLVLQGRDINTRRARIRACPRSMQDQVKARVTELWEERRA
jgi:hypothetical protein